jgi:hypothetical protein
LIFFTSQLIASACEGSGFGVLHANAHHKIPYSEPDADRSPKQFPFQGKVKFPLKLFGIVPINLLETIRLLDAGKSQRGEKRKPQ